MCELLFGGHIRPVWLVIVDYLHVFGTRIGPHEHDPPLDGSNYTKDTSAVYPLQDWQGLVSRVDTSNGVGGNQSSTYNYAAARVDLSGRGFLSFRQTIVTDLQTNIVQTTKERISLQTERPI